MCLAFKQVLVRCEIDSLSLQAFYEFGIANASERRMSLPSGAKIFLNAKFLR